MYRSHLFLPTGEVVGFNSVIFHKDEGMLEHRRLVRIVTSLHDPEVIQQGTIAFAALTLANTYLNSEEYKNYEQALPVYNIKPQAFEDMCRYNRISDAFFPMFTLNGGEVRADPDTFAFHTEFSEQEVDVLAGTTQRFLGMLYAQQRGW